VFKIDNIKLNEKIESLQNEIFQLNNINNEQKLIISERDNLIFDKIKVIDEMEVKSKKYSDE